MQLFDFEKAIEDRTHLLVGASGTDDPRVKCERYSCNASGEKWINVFLHCRSGEVVVNGIASNRRSFWT